MCSVSKQGVLGGFFFFSTAAILRGDTSSARMHTQLGTAIIYLFYYVLVYLFLFGILMICQLIYTHVTGIKLLCLEESSKADFVGDGGCSSDIVYYLVLTTCSVAHAR